MRSLTVPIELEPFERRGWRFAGDDLPYIDEAIDIAPKAWTLPRRKVKEISPVSEVLRQAGIEHADSLLALTEGDNRNLMAAQIAQKIFGVKQVIAKVNDPVRAQTYREMGINTFSRTTILGTLLHAMLQEDREVGEVLMRKALAHEAEMVLEPMKTPVKAR